MTKQFTVRTTLLVAALAVATSGCSFPKGPPIYRLASEINSTLSWLPSTISPGDTLTISFRARVEWDQQVQVHLDGTASFLAIGTIPVTGMALDELDEVLTTGYAKLVPDPDLSVGIQVEAPRTFVVIGEVLEPGEYSLPPGRPMTFNEALSKAAGHNKRTAWLSNTKIIRWVPENSVLRSFVVDARPRHWGTGEPVFIQPFDVIYVPNTNVDAVAIWIDNYIRRMIPFPYLIPQGLL